MSTLKDLDSLLSFPLNQMRPSLRRKHEAAAARRAAANAANTTTTQLVLSDAAAKIAQDILSPLVRDPLEKAGEPSIPAVRVHGVRGVVKEFVKPGKANVSGLL